MLNQDIPTCPKPKPLKSDQYVGGILFPKGVVFSCNEDSDYTSFSTAFLPLGSTLLGQKFLSSLHIEFFYQTDVSDPLKIKSITAFGSGNMLDVPIKIQGLTWIGKINVYQSENSLKVMSGSLQKDTIINGVEWKGGSSIDYVSFYEDGELRTGINKNSIIINGQTINSGSLILLKNRRPMGSLCLANKWEQVEELISKKDKCALPVDFEFNGFHFKKGDWAVFNEEGNPYRIITQSPTRMEPQDVELLKKINSFYKEINVTWPAVTKFDFQYENYAFGPSFQIEVSKPVRVLDLIFLEKSKFNFVINELREIKIETDHVWDGKSIMGPCKIEMNNDAHSFYVSLIGLNNKGTDKVEDSECAPPNNALFMDGKIIFCCLKYCKDSENNQNIKFNSRK